MKTKLSVLIGMAVLVGIASGRVEGAEWKYLGSGRIGEIYVDTASIRRLPDGTFEVWTMTQYTENGRQGTLARRSKYGLPMSGWDLLSFTVDLENIDCENRRSTVKARSHYSSDGKPLESVTINNPNSSPIVPGTYGEKILEAVCGK